MPKIAVAQVEVFDELNRNVKKVLDFIERASFKKADIICFPESCLGEDFLNINCKEIATIREKCKEKHIYCIFGAYILNNNKIFNSAILVDRLGKIQYIYRKRHLFSGLDLDKVSQGGEK